ncbi:hypothetical protein BD809_104229 [Aquimarina intermedia]|uniref:Uncharacterized protein n=1 Tax=Aquimarina intermedia TaxID=350814 RepID=A0A5S5C5J0_9FLAO|nr:hypothetical protein BD809_104229 [Aquimarina intermedia]
MHYNKYCDRHFKGHQVHYCYESESYKFSYSSYIYIIWMTCIVVNPADVHRPAKAQFQKTDKIDPRLLCKELKDERFKDIDIRRKI